MPKHLHYIRKFITAQKRKVEREINEPQSKIVVVERSSHETYLKIVSDNCFDTTGAASAGLPGLTIGEQIGGMWKSIAERRTLRNI